MSDVELAPSTETVVELSAQKPAAENKPAEAQEQKDPNWLPARLERERRALLRDLGVEKVDDAKAAIAELRKIRDAEKTETERLRAEIAELSGKAKRAEYLDSVVAVRAKSELASLTDAQREAVIAVAGDDPGAQLKAAELLRPTWAAQPVAAPPPPKQPPANTAPAAKAPPAAYAQSDDVLQTYERLKRSDPMYAAHYRLANLERYQEALKARS